MKRNYLDTFIKIVEEKSYSKAAKLLYVSQPALTQQVKVLESDLGFELFNHRNKNTVELTPAGRRFYEYACHIQAYYRTAVEECSAIAHRSLKNLYIGIDFRDLNFISPLAYTQFSEIYPDIKIQIAFDNWNQLLTKLILQKVHTVFYAEPMQLPPGFCYQTVMRIPYAIVMPLGHRLSSKTELTLNDLECHTLCLPCDEIGKDISVFRQYIQKNYPRISIDPDDYTDISFPLVQSGSKLFLTTYSAKDYFQNLCCLPLKCEFSIPMGFVYAQDCDISILRFIQIVKSLNRS